MVNYRERWNVQNSVDFVPDALRHLCDDSLNDMFSNAPTQEEKLMEAHKRAMKKHPRGMTETH